MSSDLPHSAGIEEARASALVVVPRIVERLRPKSVVDVGCGTAVRREIWEDERVAFWYRQKPRALRGGTS